MSGEVDLGLAVLLALLLGARADHWQGKIVVLPLPVILLLSSTIGFDRDRDIGTGCHDQIGVDIHFILFYRLRRFLNNRLFNNLSFLLLSLFFFNLLFGLLRTADIQLDNIDVTMTLAEFTLFHLVLVLFPVESQLLSIGQLGSGQFRL